jgi:exoribonuclease R
VNRKNPGIAFVSLPQFERDVLVIGSRNRNRAFDGDTVVISLLPKSEWRDVAEKVLSGSLHPASHNRVAVKDKGTPTDSIHLPDGQSSLSEEQLQKESEESDNLQPTARVVGVLERDMSRLQNVTGFFRPLEQDSMRFFLQVSFSVRFLCEFMSLCIAVAVCALPELYS